MTAIPQIEKQQFQNNTGGWIGVVVIGPKGDDRGASVEPGGTVWLSEAEQRLTANAPRLAKDNPFIEQTHERRNPDHGELEEFTVTPLTPCSEERWVPADSRPIPATTPDATSTRLAQMAARGEEPVVLTTGGDPVHEREMAVREAPESVQPNVKLTSRAAAAAAAAQGGQGATEAGDEGATPDETANAGQSAPNAGESTGDVPPEETGAAGTPDTPPASGEYAANEEVGTPVQTSPPPPSPSTETEGETGEGGSAPPPWNG
jgi:hypothetical protein